MPAKELYGHDSMKKSARSDFIKWYDPQINSGYLFKMKDELIKYCKADVEILREGCIKFREYFLTANKFDPLLE